MVYDWCGIANTYSMFSRPSASCSRLQFPLGTRAIQSAGWLASIFQCRDPFFFSLLTSVARRLLSGSYKTCVCHTFGNAVGLPFKDKQDQSVQTAVTGEGKKLSCCCCCCCQSESFPPFGSVNSISRADLIHLIYSLSQLLFVYFFFFF